MKNKRPKKLWRAPGNGKIFDSELGEKTKMNLRTIGVLEYIKEQSKSKGYVEKKVFESEIKSFLSEKYSADKNKSTPTHFYRPLLFFGFIYINKKDYISLTIEGNIFLEKYYKKDYLGSKRFFVNQLDNTRYPNLGAGKSEGLFLYPFRILFKLLLDNKSLTGNFFKRQLVYISDYNDIKEYVKTKKLETISSREDYIKFYTWVINSLVDVGILRKDGQKYSIHEDVLNQIEALYKNIKYENMFFEKGIDFNYLNEIISEQRVKRNYKLIQLVKERDKNLCIRNHKHKTFISRSVHYTEGHHLLPLYQQKNFDFKIDDEDNIVSLCPNCHREIHFSDNKQNIIDKLYKERISFFNKYDLDKEVLYKVYNV